MRTHDMHAHIHVQAICCLANGGRCGVVGFRDVDLATRYQLTKHGINSIALTCRTRYDDLARGLACVSRLMC